MPRKSVVIPPLRDEYHLEEVGRFSVRYTFLGTKEERLRRFAELSGEEPGAVLLGCMEERCKEPWHVEMQGRPRGYFTDFAATLEEAKAKARALAKEYA